RHTLAIMDEAERRRFLATLRGDDDFRAAARRELLTEELLALPKTVARFSTLVASLVQGQAELHTTMASLARHQATLARDQASLARDQADPRAAVNALIEHQAEMRSAITSLQATVRTLADQQAQFQRDLAALTEMMGRVLGVVGERLDRVDGEVADLRAKTAQGFAAQGERLDRLAAAVADLGRAS
ncbi:MAG: hypothetical protein ACRDZQ_16140, partial [Acidimicrobiales bacterium]